MVKPIISVKTRNEFREHFIQAGTLRSIAETFDEAGVRFDAEFSPQCSGERRSLIEQYYHSIDWMNSKSVESIVLAFEEELRDLFLPRVASSYDPVGDLKRQEEREAVAKRLLILLKFDGFEWSNSQLVRPGKTPTFDDLTKTAIKLEGTHLNQQILRMKESIESDPSLAIGTAKELIETVCKTILEERGKPVEGAPDIPLLTKALLRELELVPEGVPEQKRGSDLIKSILRSLGTIGNDLAQLRGLYGTGHGKTAKTQALKARHARLAVGAAATLVTFLYETHQQNSTKPGLSERQ